jgi:hypothetical protein
LRTSADEFLRCSMCRRYKPIRDFSFSDMARGTLNSNCRTCHAAYRRAHYLANKSDYIRRAMAQVRRRREQNRREILAYLAAHPCVDCGNSNAVVLEFDHRDPAGKEWDVGRMIVRMRWPRVLAEIGKCDVRCVNCHRRRTAREFHWAKARPIH